MKNKKPCDCPKGGVYENENGSTSICEKCDGSEWIMTHNKQVEDIMKQSKERIKNAREFNWEGGFEIEFYEVWLEKVLNDLSEPNKEE